MKLRIRPYWRREDGFAIAALAAGVIGAGVSAAGAYSQAQSQKSASEFNQKVATNNAKAAEQQSQADASLQSMRTERLKGAQSAAMAKAGISGGSGQDVTFDTSTQSELDRLTTLYKGHVEAGAYSSQAQLSGMAASAANTAGYFNMGGTLLSGAGNSLMAYSSIRNRTPDFGY